ncbi:MAG TPA: acetylglutamate kinase [Methanomassiliicoccales archaeon]|jgi:acetylglutamate kinase|nr:acetylglutamate kinase [Methanomassiliicoccales archaeon]
MKNQFPSNGQHESDKKIVVIKIGGSSIAGEERLKEFASEISAIVTAGLMPVIVHGGGPEITEEMQRRGLPVRKVAGLRVTDAAALEVAVDVLTAINGRIVCALEAAGVKAVGMMGSECDTVLCRRMPPATVKDDQGRELVVDLGLVGEVVQVHPARLRTLLRSGSVPVVFPICGSAPDELMNVNADTAAAHIARALKADQLVLITDVPGLMMEMGNEDTIIPMLRSSDFDYLVRRGIVTGGMIPKVEACRIAVEGGVRMAHMIDGKGEGSIAAQLLSGNHAGTRMIKG